MNVLLVKRDEINLFLMKQNCLVIYFKTQACYKKNQLREMEVEYQNKSLLLKN